MSRKRKIDPGNAELALKDDIRHEWTTGDFAIVSADGVRFKIDGCVLASASGVFREMIGICGGERAIYLFDPEIADSAIIDLFLGLIVNTELRLQVLKSADMYLTGLISLVVFCDRYECKAACKTLFVLAPLQLSPLQCFVLGAHADDDAFCSATLANASTEELQAFTFDAIDPDTFDLIPMLYLWALIRAWDFARPTGFHLTFSELIHQAKNF